MPYLQQSMLLQVFGMDLDTCRENIKYLFCVRSSVKYVNKIQNNSKSNSEKHFDF
jgi:hypothetical protein